MYARKKAGFGISEPSFFISYCSRLACRLSLLERMTRFELVTTLARWPVLHLEGKAGVNFKRIYAGYVAPFLSGDFFDFKEGYYKKVAKISVRNFVIRVFLSFFRCFR